MMTKHLLVLLPIFLTYALGFPKTVHIARLHDQDDEILTMFNLSVKAVNKKLSRREREREISPILTDKITDDLFEATSTICEIMNFGVASIFGPKEKITADYVQSVCEAMEVPYISVRQDSVQPSYPRGLGLNLYPHVTSLSRVYDQLVTEFKWKSFAILYENTDSLIRLHLLLKRWDTQGNSMFVYHLGNGPNYRQAMQAIKKSELENIIIDCSYDILNEVLKQAQQVGILSDKHRVIVTSLDLQTLDLEPYQYSGVNFTGLRLIDPEDPVVQQILKKLKNELELNALELRVEPALMYDAVQLFAKAFKQLQYATMGNIKNLSCDGSVRWEHGLSLSNFMRSTETKGLTGLVKFDRDGFRSNIHLDVVRLTENGLIKIGDWNSTKGNSIDWLSDTSKTPDKLSLQNRTFTVLISLTAPYGYETESSSMLHGNDRYEGFAIDIIHKISEILGFNYTFEVEPDYGTRKGKEWSGMLGKIIAGKADLAITDLTITSEREEAVDFSMPFMNLGITILYQKPTKAPPSLLSFLSPFSNDVWGYLIGANLLVSLLLFIIGRMCPAEWNNPYPCIEDAETLENQFTLKNAFWFVIGSIMQQGSEIAPIGISTRMLAGLWWFFCLIMVSSYTANLAAFLTVVTENVPFSNVEELARQNVIKYGAKQKGSTINFFESFATSKNSNYSTYKEMYKYMKANEKDVLSEDNDTGVKRVQQENYAFFMESSSIEYIMEKECNVTKIGNLLDEKGYGIAMKKQSEYRHHINSAILQLSEAGLITELKKKWWTQKRGVGKCQKNDQAGGAEELNLNNVGGVFLVLIVGVVLSCVYTVIELLWDVARTSIRENVSFKEELISELKFIAKRSSSKPVRKRNGLSSKGGSTRGCTPPYGFVPTVITTSPTEDT